MMNLYLNNRKILENFETVSVKDVEEYLELNLNLCQSEYYLCQNGKRISNDTELQSVDIHGYLRLVGGKGGFGSMLRAIGAQIEKTTNREACRDLSGRRLRDINEEKRLKTYLEKQKEMEEESDGKKKKKLEKMLMPPKHEFKDEAYEQARAELTQQVNDAVEQGFKKAELQKTNLKRKNNKDTNIKKKKKKAGLWLGAEDLSSSSETDSDSDESR